MQDIARPSSVPSAASTQRSSYRVTSLSLCLYLHIVMHISRSITNERQRFTSWSYTIFSPCLAYLRVLPGSARTRRQCVTAPCEHQTAVQSLTRGGVKRFSRNNNVVGVARTDLRPWFCSHWLLLTATQWLKGGGTNASSESHLQMTSEPGYNDLHWYRAPTLKLVKTV